MAVKKRKKSGGGSGNTAASHSTTTTRKTTTTNGGVTTTKQRKVRGDNGRRRLTAATTSLSSVVTVVVVMILLAVVLVRSWYGNRDDNNAPQVVQPQQQESSSSPRQQPQQQQQQQHQTATGDNDDDKKKSVVAAAAAADLSNKWQLLERHDHDPTAFTQGLEVFYSSSPSSTTTTTRDNQEENESSFLVVESTGHYGMDGRRGTFDEASVVRIWNVSSGSVVQQLSLDETMFGEGLTRISLSTLDDSSGREEEEDEEVDDGKSASQEDYYLLLTWMERTALLLDVETLEIRYQFQFETHTNQGWGVAYDPVQKQVYVTDGSHILHVWELYLDVSKHDNDDSNNQAVVRYREIRRVPMSLQLRLPGRDDLVERPELKLVNELEWDATTETILANLYFEMVVLRICPLTGRVLRIYEFSNLYPKEQRSPTADVMNGIAIVPSLSNSTTHQEWWLTGKYWPYIYKVRVEI